MAVTAVAAASEEKKGGGGEGEEKEADWHKSRACILSKLIRVKKKTLRSGGGGRSVRVTGERERERLHSYHVFISPPFFGHIH